MAVADIPARNPPTTTQFLELAERIPPDFVLLKVGRREHLSDLFTNGRLWLPRLSSYREIEDGCVRGDPLDGLSTQLQPSNLGIRLGPFDQAARDLLPADLPWEPDGSLVIPVTDLAGPVRVQMNAHSNLHAFCMTHHSRLWSTRPDFDRLREFGDVAVVITDPIAFLKRAGESFSALGLSAWFKLVSYTDVSAHHGEVGPWLKSDAYAWQHEARMCIEPTNDEVLDLALGSLAGIATLCPVEKLEELLEGLPARPITT